MSNRTKLRVLFSLTVILFLVAIAMLFWNISLRSELNNTASSSVRQSSQSYPLLANRIFADSPNDNILNFAPLRRELREYFGALNMNHSLYVEYLPTGTSIKINQDNAMVGASLLKVPVVMNLFYAAEHGLIDLSSSVAIQEGDIDKRSGTLWQKGVGAKVTVRDLARYAIVDSDNTAVNMLIGVASGKFDLFQRAINELDVDLTAANNSETKLGAQGYSSMLKCLYLSCLNSTSDSQQLLQWMAESVGPPRLKSELPSDILVAHKYGTSGGVSESDCGIVYVPKRPYLICVMVGTDEENANAVISSISRKVYDYITTAE